MESCRVSLFFGDDSAFLDIAGRMRSWRGVGDSSVTYHGLRRRFVDHHLSIAVRAIQEINHFGFPHS